MARACENRDRILAYREKHPNATIRQIQSACGVSSPSVVSHHLKQAEYAKYSLSIRELVDENAALRKEVKRLNGKLDRVKKIAME